MILGAILAGGQSARFGSDKALAVIDSRTLIDLTTHFVRLSRPIDALHVPARTRQSKLIRQLGRSARVPR